MDTKLAVQLGYHIKHYYIACSRRCNFVLSEPFLDCISLRFLSKMDRTAFHLAAEHGQLEVVEFLIRLGCSHSAKDKVPS